MARNAAERYNRTSDTHFGRALEYDLAFGTATSDSKKRKHEQANDEEFRIDVETDTSRGVSEVTARCVYTGRDDAFVRYLDELQLNPRILAFLSIRFFPTQQQYSTEWKYRGKILSFWNSLKLHKDRLARGRGGFPVLEKLRGIGRGMLVSCICKALDEGRIDLSSNMVLEATGMGGVDPHTSTRELVSYYEGIGFTRMFPERYESDIKRISVPMVAKVDDIISAVDIGSLSPGIIEVSQRCRELRSHPVVGSLSASRVRGDRAKDREFRIDVETDASREFSEVTARCVYTGRDDELIRYLDDLLLNPRSLALLSIRFFDTQQQYREHTEWKYRGKILRFWNSLKLHKDRLARGRGGFPVLEKLRGIGRGMLLSCICKALDEGRIDLSSNMVIEATGMSGVDPHESTRGLVRYCEGIGFTRMFPERYESDIKRISVPMVAKVEDIIRAVDIGSLSPGIIEVSQRCKELRSHPVAGSLSASRVRGTYV